MTSDQLSAVPSQPDTHTHGLRAVGSHAKRFLSAALPPLVAAAIAVGVVYLVHYVFLSDLRKFLLPAPHKIVENGFLNGRNLRDQLQALWDTAKVSALGLAIAFLIGSLLAILMSQAKWLERSLYPYAVIIQVTPILAIVPLIAIWFGYDFSARVVVCVMISLFPIVTNTLHGLLTVDRNLHDVFTLHHAGRLKRLLKLQLPHAVPEIFVGLRISAGLSVVGAIVGEYFFRQGTPGLGRLLDVYRANLQTDLLMSCLLFCVILGLLAFAVIGAVGRQLTKSWYDEGQRQ